MNGLFYRAGLFSAKKTQKNGAAFSVSAIDFPASFF